MRTGTPQLATWRLLLAVLAVLVFAAHSSALAPGAEAPSAGSISGTVLLADSGDPAAGALVQASADLPDSSGVLRRVAVAALSDSAGRYLLAPLRAGLWDVWCAVPDGEGYHGDQAERPASLRLADGEIADGVDFEVRQSVPPEAPDPSSTSPARRAQNPLVEVATYRSGDGAQSAGDAAADAQGYTWFVPVDGGITGSYRFDGRRFAPLATAGARLGSHKTGSPGIVARDTDGQVWIGGDDGLVRMWNGGVNKHFTEVDGLRSNTVLAVRADSTHGVWVMTARGISHVRGDTVETMVDSSQLDLEDELAAVVLGPSWRRIRAGMEIDRKGGVWWWTSTGSDRSGTVCRIPRRGDAPRQLHRLRLCFPLTHLQVAGSGVIVRHEDGRMFHFPSNGAGRPLDPGYARYLGADSRGLHYFSSEGPGGQVTLHRDAPDSAGYVGLRGSPQRFAYSKSLELHWSYRLVPVRDEMWLSQWMSDGPAFAIRGEEISRLADVYPVESRKGSFVATDHTTVWILRWQAREVTELHFKDWLEYVECPDKPNGLFPLSHDVETERIRFLATDQTGVALMSFSQGEWSEVYGTKHFREPPPVDKQGTTWIREDERVVRISREDRVDETKVRARLISPDDRGGCFVATSDSEVAYYGDGKLQPYRVPGLEPLSALVATEDGAVYLVSAGKLFHWRRDQPERARRVENVPADSLLRVWRSSGRAFWHGASSIGWLEDGQATVIDTRRFRRIGTVSDAHWDGADRLFLWEGHGGELVREVWLLEGGDLHHLPLPRPCRWLAGTSNEAWTIFYSGDSVILKYDETQRRLHLLEDAGDYLGFAWGVVVSGNSLFASGWDTHFLRIDLDRAGLWRPPLSFQEVSIDGRPVSESRQCTLRYGSTLEANYLAIEKLTQAAVRYQTRISDLDPDWSDPTANESATLRRLPPGDYRLEVRARGESGVWTDAIGIDILALSPWYATAWAYAGYVIGVSFFLLGVVKVTQRRAARRHELEEIEAEINTAHDMQMRLMPLESPLVPGYGVAGHCVPASRVGGDLFKYYELPGGCLGGVLVDVTGHAMEAAVSLLIFNGVLESQIELGGSMADLFVRLNRSLCRTFPTRTYVCFTMAELHPPTGRLRLSNAGCPYPYHYRASDTTVAELQMDAYPLGVRPDTVYPVVEVQLEKGDYVVFCSDGLIEMENESEELFGYERTAAAVREACLQRGPASTVAERLLSEVREFAGKAIQRDDTTIVVLEVGADG